MDRNPQGNQNKISQNNLTLLPACLLFSCSVVSDSFAAPWTVACQAPLSMGFSRQGYWNGLPFPSPGDLSDPGIKPVSPAWKVDSLPLSHQGSTIVWVELQNVGKTL